jgi:hypothetical protein
MRHMPLDHIKYRLPLIEGRALRAGLIATDPMLDVEISGGYISQEIKQRRAA